MNRIFLFTLEFFNHKTPKNPKIDTRFNLKSQKTQDCILKLLKSQQCIHNILGDLN
jgi:hypothetical protein